MDYIIYIYIIVYAQMLNLVNAFNQLKKKHITITCVCIHTY